MQPETNTIVALATPPGVSALAVVRISGPAVPAICKALLPKFKMQPRTAQFTKTDIDELIAIYFPAPNSHTGEDILELFPHGNPFIIRLLIKKICSIRGVRLANKGEFTERAFLNGKIDLTQAEALGDILSASNLKSLSNAQKLLNGEISSEIKELTEKIKEISAKLELAVDFTEDTNPENPSIGVIGVQTILQSLKKRFRKGGNELPRAVLFGAPNAGKSTLINSLVNEDRLLVSEIPGTTRDFVEVPLHLPDGDILLIDTAGLAGEAQNEIDERAMQKTKKILEKANLKILVVDVSIPYPPEYEEWKKFADLIVETHIGATHRGCPYVNELIKSLNNIFFPKTEETEEAWIVSERQINCIKKAEECVMRAVEQLKQANAIELAAFEMREARAALCSITGEISDENVLDAIFNSYCIGK